MAIPRNLANIAPHVNASSTELVVNDGGANLDFRVEGDTDANLLFVDAGNDKLGIGTSSPSHKLDVEASAGNGTFVAEFTNTNSASDGRGIINLVGNSSGAVSTLVFAGGRYFGTDNDTLAVINNAAAGGISFCVGGIANSTRNEKARINPSGFFKASNTGSYNSTTSEENEFRSNSDNISLWVQNTNAGFSRNGIFGANLLSKTSRSANSGFSLIEGMADSDVEFNFRGDGNGYADGTFNNNGADYAEYFESTNGQALTLGATVVLDGNKVREATDQDPASAVIGVVRPKEPSKASMVIGNTAWNKWANKYLTDDFDRYIMEDHDVVEWEETITDENGSTSTKSHSYESHNIPEGITVPADATIKTHDDKDNKFQHYKLNPAWDKDSEYTPREQRPEWNIIGLLGQVKILKGQPVGDRWVKMRDVSETVEEWFIR